MFQNAFPDMSPLEDTADLSKHPGSIFTPDDADEKYRLRPYQAEMVRESLRSNIICVMDTGSGKTHVAIERTRVELETCDSDKIVWFLAPTVTLCEQQYETFKTNLPGFGIRMLSGKDNVDNWTDQRTWDLILTNIRIVLSTHKVLLDALTHAFVNLGRISLLVFDEAHHCIGDHPAHCIMRDFYMPRLVLGEQVPKILGLSASPVMNAKASSNDLRVIEQNLCATARTPKLHRAELLRFVHRPTLIVISHMSDGNIVQPSLVWSLQTIARSYDLTSDPYVIDLVGRQQDGYASTLKKVFLTQRTSCFDQIKALSNKAAAMSKELGPSPAEWYVQQTIEHYNIVVNPSDAQLGDLSIEEKRHLLGILDKLKQCPTSIGTSLSLDQVSRKVELLIEVLVDVAAETPDFTGLVFVEQRVWIAALAEILTKHPRTKDLFSLGTYIGVSPSSNRKTNIASLAEPKNQPATLDDFRSGKINLILTTSVLEEGIDVSNCHLVICFERPKNLKSFIQRRGRARMQKSKYVVFTPEVNGGRPQESWQSLEEEMKAAYLDDVREVKLAEERELQDEEGRRFFRVESTGALLTLENATQHLTHFCATLNSGPYIDTRPQYDFAENDQGFITANVTLPIFVDPKVRTAIGIGSWRTEKMARKDVAFEAYKTLYLAGLINENLLPARQEVEEDPGVAKSPNSASVVMVPGTLDPWPIMARLQQQVGRVYNRAILSIQFPQSEPTYLMLFTTTPAPALSDLKLHWNESQSIKIDTIALGTVTLSEEEIEMIRFTTYKLMKPAFSRIRDDRYDYLWMATPCDSLGSLLHEANTSVYNATRQVVDVIAQGATDTSTWGLVKMQNDGQKFVAKSILKNSKDMKDGAPETIIRAIAFPKCRDFLLPVNLRYNSNHAHTRLEDLDASRCSIESMPVKYSLAAVLLPSILHRLEMGFIAETLMTTLLKPVGLDHFKSLPVIIQAITSSNTGLEDYQRLEFLGDCILKYIASVNLMSQHILWPEGQLTAAKVRVVSNGYLAKASLAAGLDKFIITKRLKGAKWLPLYVGDLVADTKPPAMEQRSSKMIADVVESLIGASHTIGGLDKAFTCVKTLLPQEPWTPISTANALLYQAAYADPAVSISNSYQVAQDLIGYSFNKKPLLLEALTHASFRGPYVQSSYERLEFLGDAVLDYIVTRHVFAHETALPHWKMHAIRTAVVNAEFLTFRMFETTTYENTINKTTFADEKELRALWQFLRVNGEGFKAARDKALRQHATSRDVIAKAIEHDAKFPWHLTCLIDAPKALSDIVESVLGAIYVDSEGDIAACEDFARNLGILPVLERILRDEVDCLHPKERLGHLAGQRIVEYVKCSAEYGPSTGENVYRCQVRVGGEEVGGKVEGLKRSSAETVAAYKACAILEQQNDVSMSDTDGDDEFFDAEEGGGVRMD